MCKRNERIEVSNLTKKEYDLVIQNANFTEEQQKVFEALNKDRLYDFAIMIDLKLSTRRYYHVKAVVIDKVERIAQEYGFIQAIIAHK